MAANLIYLINKKFNIPLNQYKTIKNFKPLLNLIIF